jgi:hypothetical protein
MYLKIIVLSYAMVFIFHDLNVVHSYVVGSAGVRPDVK